MTDKPLMTLSEVAKALGVSRYCLYDHPDVLSRLKARTPLGYRRYARVLVERLVNDESLSSFGRRSA